MLKFVVLSVLVAYVAAHPEYSSRIVNGTNAKLGEIPYIISVHYFDSITCGGSILDKRHVLTAAHCVDGNTPNVFSVQFGVLNINSKENIIAVEAIYEHEEYAPENNYANDIAVLKLKGDIVFSQNVQPVKLPAQDEKPPAGKSAVLAGWGYNKSGGSKPNVLQRVDVIIYTDENCKAAHGSNVDFRYQLCAGVPKGGKGQCRGDSGGPLNSNGIQWGIASWSLKPCADKRYPGVFARVPSYINWIKSKQLL